MKKILFFALVAIVSMGASAQDDSKIRFGAQGFVGINSIGADGTKSICTYGAGVIAEYNFSEKIYLGTGLNYQIKGWKNSNATFNISYLTLPIQIGTRFNLSDNLKMHIQAGPQLAYGVTGDDLVFDEDKIKYKDWGNRFEFGAGAKIGVEFSNIQVNLSGNYGFTKVLEPKGFKKEGNNLDFTVGVAYMF